jgi:hypothetical protein
LSEKKFAQIVDLGVLNGDGFEGRFNRKQIAEHFVPSSKVVCGVASLSPIAAQLLNFGKASFHEEEFIGFRAGPPGCDSLRQAPFQLVMQEESLAKSAGRGVEEFDDRRGVITDGISTEMFADGSVLVLGVFVGGWSRWCSQ